MTRAGCPSILLREAREGLLACVAPWGGIEVAFEKVKARRTREREAAAARGGRVRTRLVERGRPVFERYGVDRVVLSGSVREGCSTEGSDVDLLVMPLAAEQYWSFRHDLEEALEVSVDLYTEDDDRDFVRKILERGETIYEVRR